jgi:methylase of polypeptide subunit release factors
MEIDLSKINDKAIIKKIKEAASRADTEEDFKIQAVQILRDEVLDKFELPYGKFEKGILVSGQRGRADVLYGHLFIEFEKPGVLTTKRGFDHAIGQLRNYIKGDAKAEKNYSKYFGVALDGEKIGFVRYKEKDWPVQGPFDLNSHTIIRLLEALRGLYKKPLDAEYLIKDFGPESITTKEVVKFLYNKLERTKSERTKTLFSDWKRVFSQVCAYSPEKVKGLEKAYDLPARIDPDILLFTIHSYYALIMKLIAAEVAVLYGEPYMQSYIRRLEDGYLKGHDNLKRELDELEEGGIFSKIGIVNFLEADYFSWYLNEWDENTSKEIIRVVKELANYEVGTAELEPERIKDLFKRLYQFLVPKNIRHDLGEYYTPDWLAELLLNEIEYDGKPESRLLDPACGSGTFLVLALKRIKKYQDEHFLDIGDTLNKITNNVIGFDLNPLAVLASRTNYLIAIGDYIRQRKAEKIRIPVFLADSILVERKKTLFQESYVLKTVVGEFNIPISVVNKGLLTSVLEIVEDCVKDGKYQTEEFKARIQNEIRELREQEVYILAQLFEQLLKLEKQDKNRIWVRVLKNSFAPLFEGNFDYVVGNPPWINWESLPESYRISTRPLWEQYGLTEKTSGMGLGKVKRDVAMLFVARCFDRYTKEDGKLGFLIPFTTYKTQTGAGFRKYLAYHSRIKKIHDLVELYPFEGAVNRTSLIIIEKGENKFPVSCVMWTNPKSSGIPQQIDLKTVKKNTGQFDMIMTPIKERFPETPWMIIRSENAYEAIKKVIGVSLDYDAHMGIKTALNSAYWVSILSREKGGLLVKNLKLPGQKKSVKEIEDIVEPDLVYPLSRGRNLKRWFIEEPDIYMITPHSNVTGKPLTEREMKTKYPKTYNFLFSLKKDLENRSIHKLWGKENPFYSLYDIGNYSFSDYKIAWKEIAGKITGKAVGFASAVIEPKHIKKIFEKSKPVLPDNKIIAISTSNKDEAYYVCGILNSSPVLTAIASYTYEIGMETHIIKNIFIPKFNSKDKLHLEISEISKKAHELAKRYYEKRDQDSITELKRVEDKIDNISAKIYGIEIKELLEIKKSLSVLKGENNKTS